MTSIFWSKKRVFWVYLGHFLDFGPGKKIWKRKNSRNVGEVLWKIRKFSIRVNLKIFLRKNWLTTIFGQKRGFFGSILVIFWISPPQKKCWTWTCIIWDIFCQWSFSVEWVSSKMTFWTLFSKRGWKGVLDGIFEKGKILGTSRRSIVKN